MTTDPIRILFASDIHFGVRSCSAEEMAWAFVQTIFPLLEKTDIFFINGDLFDDLINFDGFGFDPIYTTLHNLFSWCEKHGVILRVLQGTYSHDRNQCKRLETFYTSRGATFDFKYYGTIDLEEIAVRGRSLKVCYVPDTLPYKTSQDAVDVVLSKMHDMGWDYLDYACMHGFFEETFPKNIPHGSHLVFRQEQFPFVRKAIDCGHVHQYQAVGKFISNGSLDRTVFGDEEPKGCVMIEDYPDKFTATFVENKHAAVFDTLVFSESDDTVVISKTIADHIAKLDTQRQISLRFSVATQDQYDAIRTFLRTEYPHVRCYRHKKSDKANASIFVPPSQLLQTRKQRPAPTKENLHVFIREYIPEEYTISQEKIKSYLGAAG